MYTLHNGMGHVCLLACSHTMDVRALPRFFADFTLGISLFYLLGWGEKTPFRLFSQGTDSDF